MKRSKLTPILITWIIWYHVAESRNNHEERTHRTVNINKPNYNEIQRYRDTRSIHRNKRSSIEVLLHMPSPFQNFEQFKNFVGGSDKERRKREIGKEEKNVELSYVPNSEKVESVALTVEGDSNSPELRGKYIQSSDPDGIYSDKMGETIIELPEPIRGPVYTTYAENFEDDPDDPRKRRNTSANDHDEVGSQRDKRTYMENGDENREGTTTQPYWKRKKDSPTFVTGRDGRVQKANEYTPAQHRTDGARESHSMKDKSVQSNEIPRTAQDNYYASSNRRAYNSRQAENFNTATPKSVYDLYDYNNPRRNQESRSNYGRNSDLSVKDDRSRPVYPAQQNDFYVNGYPRQYQTYGFPRVYYDRTYPYYFPYPGEVVGRGVEYYHRTIDPHSGRIIYYANMPDSARTYDGYNGRAFYSNGRTYIYDAYGRVIPFPPDYKPLTPDPYLRNYDTRYGRSNNPPPVPGSAPDGYPNGGDKFPRGARYDTSKMDRYKDYNRNKTYVIYDADEKRTNYARTPYNPLDYNRYLYPVPGPVLPPQAPIPTVPFPQYPTPSVPSHLYRGYYYHQPPALVAPWHQRPLLDPSVTYSPRPLSSDSNRSTLPTSSYDKIKKV